MSTPESQVKRKVSALLSKYGTRVYRFMPVQGGYGAASLDYLGCAAGRFFAVETKAPGKKPTERQLKLIGDMRAAGATVFVIIGDHGLDALETWLDQTTATH
jgi:hypothetical protein